MPTPRKNIRTYCKSCEDFTIHSQTNNLGEKLELTCGMCDTIGTPYDISNVDKDKVEAQRKRYKDYKLQEFRGIHATFLTLGALNGYDGITTVEDDAGQKKIDEAEKQRRQELIEARKVEVSEYKTTYKNIGRNDVCACGSGKKYKKCHLSIHLNRKLV